MPKPLLCATASTGSSVVSSRRRARRMRSARIHCSGVVPVLARKRRANVRGLIAARSARSPTATGSARCSRSQASVSPNRSAPAGSGIGASMYCAWPPGRCSGTTRSRATLAAVSAPWSRCTRYRHRSRLAALPAEVSRFPSSTYSTLGSTRTRGYRRARSAHSDQCVVAVCPSSSPASASANAPVHSDTIRLPSSLAARSASSTAAGAWPVTAPGATTMVSAARATSRPLGTCIAKPAAVITDGAGPQTDSRYRGRPSGPVTAVPKTSIPTASSNSSTPSNTTIAT